MPSVQAVLGGSVEVIGQGFYERCIREERKRWHKGDGVQDRAWQLGPFRVTTIFGGRANGITGPTPYKTDLQIGRFAVHIFWRGDDDPDPHDHQMDFWTFPLVGYVEQVLTEPDIERGFRTLEERVVSPFRVHHRPAEYTHRVKERADRMPMSGIKYNALDRMTGELKWPIITLVWRGRKRRDWYFWKPTRDGYGWYTVPWKTYIAQARGK